MPATTTPTDTSKPCQLQINTAGAWKHVISFDAADEHASNEVLESASSLAQRHTGAPASLRIIEAGVPSEVLMHWTKRTGWEARRHAAN